MGKIQSAVLELNKLFNSNYLERIQQMLCERNG